MSLAVKIGIALVLLIALAGIAFGIEHEFIEYGKAQYAAGELAQKGVDQQAEAIRDAQAATTLATVTAQVTALNKALAATKATQEVNDAKNTAKVAALTKQLSTVRLRDPGAVAYSCGGSSGSANGGQGNGNATSSADTAQAPGVLSAGFDTVLLNLAADADQINDAYTSCRALLIPASP